jgi:hypothetical protein
MKINKEIKIVDHPKQWFLEFRSGWLQYYEDTGIVDWARYNYLKNEFPPKGEGIDKENIRLILISVAGGYDVNKHAPFDEAVLPGDLSVRNFKHPIESGSIAFPENLAKDVAHNVLEETFFPIHVLEKLKEEGYIEELIAETVSINGDLPNVLRVEKELLPKVIARIEATGATAALLIPAGDLSVQTAMLLARGLELCKIPSVMIGIDYQCYEKILPPRIVFFDLNRKHGWADMVDEESYAKILKQAMVCLTMDAPILIKKV